MSQTQKINRFSEASQRLVKDKNQTEIFELSENSKKPQCPDCKSFTEVGIIYCRCGRNQKHNRSRKRNFDCNSIRGYIIRNNCSRGSKHGPTERQEKLVLQSKKAKKIGFPTILARKQEQQSYRSSLKDHDTGEQEVIIYDRHALERHDYTATKAERKRYSENWVLTLNAERETTTSTTTPRLRRRIHGSKSAGLYTRINNFKDLKNMTTLFVERQDGGGILSSRETCRILRLRRLHHGKIPLGNGSNGGGIPRNMMSSE